MSAREAWYDWLEGLRATVGSYKAIADQLKLHHNTVLLWMKAGLPDIEQEVPLATLAGEEVTVLRRRIDAARDEINAQRVATERARLERRRERLLRPQPGTVRPPAVPSPRRIPVSNRKARRKLAAWAFALLTVGSSGGAPAQPLPVDSAHDGLLLIGHWRRKASTWSRKLAPPAFGWA